MSDTNACCVHAIVSGRVQGVCFRAFVRDTANAQGVTGWAHNIPDGTVEVMLYGDNKAVNTVLDALHQGPPMATVTGVVHRQQPWEECIGFTIA